MWQSHYAGPAMYVEQFFSFSVFQIHITRDRMGPERTGNGVPVLFHDVEPFICYFLIRDSYFYVLFVVHCTLHASRVPSLNLALAQFSEKS